MSKTNVKNSDSVSFGELSISTTLNGGFDGDTPKKHKREIQLHFTGFDEINDDTTEKLLEELASKLRIKVNQTNGELKGHAFDAESYAKFLDDNGCEFTFNVAELMEPKTQAEKSKEEIIFDLMKKGKLSRAEVDAIMAVDEEAAE